MKTFYLRHFFKTSILMLTILLGTSSWGQTTWNKLTNHSDVTSSGTYMIVDVTSGKALTSANLAASAPAAVDVSAFISGTTITGEINDNLQWTFEQSGTDYIIHPKGSAVTWLYSTNTNNGVRVGSNTANTWTLGVTSGTFKGFKHAGTSRYMGVYNNADWRTYTSVHANIAATNIEVFQLQEVTTPTLSISTEEITGLNYIFTNGPSDAQSFTLSGMNLDGTGDVLVGLDDGASSDFEISLNATSGYDTDLFIEGYDGTDTEIFVRLKAGKAVGNSYGDIITIQSDYNLNEDLVLVLGEVTALPSVPLIAEANLTATVGVAFSYQIVASNEPTSYAISSEVLPAGLSLDTETGLITGTPTVAGEFIIGVTATNISGTSGEAVIIFEIAKGTQTLVGFEDQNKYDTDAPFTFAATTTQGFTVDYDSDDLTIATVSGNTITITGIGTTTIWAMSNGDANWEDFIETITLTVTEAPVIPNVIISQVYEGASNNKWIELTNLGATDADLSQLKVAIWSVSSDSGNGNIIPGAHTSDLALTGTLSPGATFLIKNSSASNTAPHNPMPTAIVGGNVTNFNGNDALALLDLDNNIVDAFGHGINNKDKSFHRVAEVLGQNSTFTLTEWVEKTLAQVASADNTMSEYIGTHIFSSPTSIVWTTDNQWSNITGPSITDDVVIEGVLSVTALNSFDAKSIIINGSMTIQNEGIVTVANVITNNGNFIVEDGGNLIQTNNVTNTGAIKVKKNSSLIKHLDYTAWSSPVAGQDLQAFSPQTLAYRITSYNTTNDTWEPISGNFEAGKGYMFRAPNDFVTTPYIYAGEFNGVANNGNIGVNFANVGVYQGIGNPYPSNISAAQFWAANPGTATLYFWTNINAWDNQAQEYVANNWATYSLAGGVAAFGGSKVPTNAIEVGQGFVVETDNSMGSVSFDNTMRTATNGVFFRAATTEKHRMWLNFSSANGPLNQILVGYMDGATNAFDLGVDSKMFGWNGSALYSLIDNDNSKFTIQGRAMPFDDYDVVPLGLRASQAGTFTVSIANLDGIFAENQDIFLKDNLTQTQHNLKDADYTFVSAQGEFLNRFEIVYRAALSVTTPELDNTWVVYAQDNNFNIQTQSFDLKDVVVYDMLGRVIYQSAAEGTTHTIANLTSNGVMVVKITTTDGQEFSRKVAK